MKKIVLLFCLSSSTLWAVDYTGGDIWANNFSWLRTNFYHGQNQRGGPFKFDDSYLELEFGGRAGIVDYYGYVDFLDILNDSKNSDKHDGTNSFAKVDARFSFDAMFKQDLALGAVKEWYISTEMMDADYESAGGLRVFWLGLGTDTYIPWLGLTGLNFHARKFAENFGASNEGKWDGYIAHINWFTPFYTFENKHFLSFQGYADYEFASRIEGQARSNNAFQSYLGVWFNASRYALGYGMKLYRNMSQFEDGELFFGRQTDTTGVAHYFNISYKL